VRTSNQILNHYLLPAVDTMVHLSKKDGNEQFLFEPFYNPLGLPFPAELMVT
jgi:hypothetical protein